jgi:hypothetical protein
VADLTPADLRRAVEAPVATATRSLHGPTAERIRIGDRTVWRVRIPGEFEVRSARVRVTVGATVVGAGIVTPHLDALVAVTTDPAALASGAAVSYQWQGGPVVPAGRLAVAS